MAGMLHEMFVDRIIESNMAATPPPGLPPGDQYHVRSFRDAGGHLWFGGTFGKNLSFMTSLGIEQELAVESGRFGSPSHAHWDFAFFQYNNIFNSGTGVANIKFGSFELELPFSNLRRLSSALAPYEVYNIRGVKGSFRLSSPQVGTALNGIVHKGLHAVRYEFALVNGTNGHFDSNVEFDYYGRVAVSRILDGFIKHVRVGGLYYSGVQNLRDLPGNPYPTEDMIDYWDINVHNEPDNSKFYRWGVDASVDVELVGYPINLYGQYLVGHDDDIDMTNLNLPYFGEGEGGGHDHLVRSASSLTWLVRPFDFTGGFVGADVVIIPSKLYFISRYDWVDIQNQWADPVNGGYIRDYGSSTWEYGDFNNDGEPDEWSFGDPMPNDMTDAQTVYSRYVVGFRWHLLQPITLVYEYGSQDNLFGFPEPTPDMYNPDWVAGMGRTVNVDSDWHMFMVMFAF